MPLTELVALVSVAMAYLVGLMFWFAHFREVRRTDAVSGIRRLAGEPATALLGSLPLLAAFWFVVVWRILPVWS